MHLGIPLARPELPKWGSQVSHQGTHSSIGVVDQEVKLAGLLLLDPLEQLLHLCIYGVVHLNCHRSTSPCLDLLGTVLQVGEGPPSNINCCSSSSKLQRDPSTDAPGSPCHQADLTLQ